MIMTHCLLLVIMKNCNFMEIYLFNGIHSLDSIKYVSNITIMYLTCKYFTINVGNRVSIVGFIVGNTVEFVNVTMNPTNSNKVSENRKKKKVLAPTEN